MVMSGIACCAAKTRSSGSRAMVPSSLATSQITPDGALPARYAWRRPAAEAAIDEQVDTGHEACRAREQEDDRADHLVDICHRFIEDEQARIQRQRLGDFDELLPAGRKTLYKTLGDTSRLRRCREPR